jgi:hypothetical protein
MTNQIATPQSVRSTDSDSRGRYLIRRIPKNVDGRKPDDPASPNGLHDATKLGSIVVTRAITEALTRGLLAAPLSGYTQLRQSLLVKPEAGSAALQQTISRQVGAGPGAAAASKTSGSGRAGVAHLELRAQLQKRIAGEEVERIETRRRELEVLIRSLDSETAFDLVQRLSARVPGDELSELFHDELATETRKHLLKLLYRRMTSEAPIPSVGPPQPGKQWCRPGQAILIDERGQAHCLAPTDEWFDSRYVDHNIAHAVAFPDAEEAVERILSGQAPGYERRLLRLLYAGGGAVTIELDRVQTGGPPLGVHETPEDRSLPPSTGTARGAQLRYKPTRFVMRKGIIFPDPETYDPGSTPNIVEIAAAAKEEFAARRVFLKMAVLAAPFASSIGALASFHGQVRDVVGPLNSVVMHYRPEARHGSAKPEIDPVLDEAIEQAFQGLPGEGGGAGGRSKARSGIGVRVPATKGPSLALKSPYQPRKGATPSENRVGELLQQKLRDEAVYGSAEQFKKTRSGDYRLVHKNGHVTSADLFEPEGAVGGVARHVMEGKGSAGRSGGFSQAEIAVVEFGKGETASFGVDEARRVAREVLSTPSHDISRLIFVKGDEIILDTNDTL